MMKKILFIIYLIIIIPYLCFAKTKIEEKIKVNYLEGNARYQQHANEEWLPLSEGDYLNAGDTIKVLEDSRIELKFNDGSVARFNENTTFIIQIQKKKGMIKKGIIRVKLIMGKVWANILKTLNVQAKFEVETATAVAGIRGTILRVDEDPHKPARSTLIKVYKGTIEVNPPYEIGKPYTEIKGPHEVPGPYEVPGPHEVSLEEWEEIVLQSKEQLVLSSEGKVVKKEPFDPSIDEARDEWVKWNMKRDKL